MYRAGRGWRVSKILKKKRENNFFLLLSCTYYDHCSCEYIVRYTNPNKFIKKQDKELIEQHPKHYWILAAETKMYDAEFHILRSDTLEAIFAT